MKYSTSTRTNEAQASTARGKQLPRGSSTPPGLDLQQVLLSMFREALVEALRDPAAGAIIRGLIRDEVQGAVKELAAGTSLNSTISVKEAAQFAGVTEGTIRDWIAKGRLRALRSGNRYRIKPEELENSMTQYDSPEHVSLEDEANKIIAFDAARIAKERS